MIRKLSALLVLGLSFLPAANAQETGVNPFSAQAVVSNLSEVCGPAMEAGATVAELAAQRGLSLSQHRRQAAWALTQDAQAWDVPTRDGRVLLYGYGPEGRKCGLIVLNAMPDAVREAVARELQGAPEAYRIIQTSDMGKGATFTRLQSASTGHYVDVIDYSKSALLKVELLP